MSIENSRRNLLQFVGGAAGIALVGSAAEKEGVCRRSKGPFGG